ncbi:hypothetical protein [Streptomyces dysideae]|uniref:Uncharacterized protein n=1 Tax=Streptomyces dysideae TaxID=909626 RepID=A0A117S2N2_9ACTN|nr:hypothetical protein [Streptomyces dysideae]KUO22384.1 hypothetical protein AQJ91_04240 [Streptomyces dysideae]
MTHRARNEEPDTSLGSSADEPGRDAVPRRGDFLEFPGLMPAAGALVLLVVGPEAHEALVRALATSTAGLVR